MRGWTRISGVNSSTRALRKHGIFTYYESGHMMYMEKKSGEKLDRDVAAFIADEVTTGGGGL